MFIIIYTYLASHTLTFLLDFVDYRNFSWYYWHKDTSSTNVLKPAYGFVAFGLIFKR